MFVEVLRLREKKRHQFYQKKQTSLLSVQAALDHNLKSLPLRKKFSLCDNR